MTTAINCIPPQNIDAERALIGSCFVDGQTAVDEASVLININDFYVEAHRVIWEVVLQLSFRRTPIDIITISEALGENLQKIGGHAYLLQLATAVPSAQNIAHYAQIIKNKSLARGKISECQEVIRKLLDEADPVSVISKSMLADMRLLNDSHKGEIVKAGDKLIDVYTEIEASVGSNGITGVPTGYDELDRIGGGLQPGLIILAARPSVGKTTFALNIARNVANSKFIVLIFSLEMTKKQLIRKLLAMEANIDSKYFNNAGEINDTQWTRLSHALGSLHEAGIYLDDTSGLKASEIMVKSRRFKSLHPELKMIIIDYLQLIAPENNYGTTNDKISDTSKIVKLVAKELDLPVVALSQLSRSLETRKDKTPILADLRDSGSLEQDADVVMFLHRDDYYNPKDAPADPSYTDLIVAKNRLDGGVGAVELKYYKARQRFEPAKQNYPQVKTR